MPRSRTLGITVGITAVLALGGIAGAAFAATAPPTTAPPATTKPGWHVVKAVGSGVTGDFTAVVATGKTTGWAFDGNPIAAPTSGAAAWERSGSTWKRVPFPAQTNEEVVAASATSTSDVWAFTEDLTPSGQSRVLRWNGHHWSVAKTFTDLIGSASVVAANDVWVFGQPGVIERLGAWHYNGRTWSQVSKSAEGGSALAANNVWAFSGTRVLHWNGRAWANTSVAKLLPPATQFNDPMLTGIYAASADSVYAVGNGDLEDDGGPMVLLHYNGARWDKVAAGNFGYGTEPSQQISPDGSGGLWLPMPGYDGQRSYLVHYSAGKLSKAALPTSAADITVESVAHVPGTTQELAGGFTHAKDDPELDVTGVLLASG